MEIEFKFWRSKEWLRGQQIAMGENIPDESKFKCDVSELPTDCREIVMSNNTHYPSTFSSVSYGTDRFYLEVDCLEEKLDITTLCAALRVAKKAADSQARKLEEIEERRHVLASAMKAKVAAKDAARELLADEIKVLQRHSKDRHILSYALLMIPRDILKEHIGNQQEVEEASSQWLFDNCD